ncbi:MAG: radical SAM mobile pair protein B [Synergistaceae bacterium]|nr:radical SAM mobile pair protein B [Synergistaceae bacterium]
MQIREIKVQSILTKTRLPIGGYAANPYVGCPHACKYCYASFMKRFTNHPEPWGEFLDVKFWPEIKQPAKYSGQEIFLSSVTDPYNPCEEQYKRTRALLLQLKDSGAKLTIQTKSDLILRDLDLLKNFQDVRVGFSINTLDENFKAVMDNAPSIARRINAMQTLYNSKIKTTCFISPIFPGITDVQAIINCVKNFCNLIWLEDLNLRGDFKYKILNFIRQNYAGLAPIYDEIYINKSRVYWDDLDDTMREFAAQNNFEYVRNQDDMSRPFNAPPRIVNYFYHKELLTK